MTRPELEALAREWADGQVALGCAHAQPGSDYSRPCHDCVADLLERVQREAVAEERKALHTLIEEQYTPTGEAVRFAVALHAAIDAREKESK